MCEIYESLDDTIQGGVFDLGSDQRDVISECCLAWPWVEIVGGDLLR